jgi:cation:H+ antiporter
MVLVPILLIGVGLIIVVFCADEAIKRLLTIARFFRLSEFISSFVLAGVITILPELSIGIVAAFSGSSSLGFGVIIGSNVIDLTLIVGVVVLYSGKLTLDSKMVKSIRMSLVAVLLPIVLFFDGEISRLDGLILIAAFSVYVALLVRDRGNDQAAEFKRRKLKFIFEFVIFAISIAILFLGASLVTSSAQETSVLLGLPLFVIGIVVAIGTCLPELVFALRACNKKHCGLGLGNILGNVLADSMLTIGVVSLIQPIRPISPMPVFITGVAMALSAIIVYWTSRDGVLDRKNGALLLGVFGLFLVIQVFLETFNVVI